MLVFLRGTGIIHLDDASTTQHSIVRAVGKVAQPCCRCGQSGSITQRTRRHIILCVQGVVNVKGPTATTGGTQATDGRAGARRAHTGRVVARASSMSTRNPSTTGLDKPPLTAAGRCPARRARLAPSVKSFFGFVASFVRFSKSATSWQRLAWFAGRSDATSTKSSDL